MAELNELSKLEQELKQRINQRVEDDKVQPVRLDAGHVTPHIHNNSIEFAEHLRQATLMVVKEHGQPFKFKSNEDVSFATTGMDIREH